MCGIDCSRQLSSNNSFQVFPLKMLQDMVPAPVVMISVHLDTPPLPPPSSILVYNNYQTDPDLMFPSQERGYKTRGSLKSRHSASLQARTLDNYPSRRRKQIFLLFNIQNDCELFGLLLNAC